MDGDIMPDLAELIGLRELTLLHPTRALFMVLYPWIYRLKDTLVSFHLLVSCYEKHGVSLTYLFGL